MIKPQQPSVYVEILKIIDIVCLNIIIFFCFKISSYQFHYSFINISIVFTISYFFVSYINKIYDSWRFSSIKKIIFNLFINWLYVFLFSFFLIFFLKLISPLSRQLFIFFILFPFVYFAITRFVGYKILKLFRKKGWNYKKISILGTNDKAKNLAKTILSANWMGIDIVNFVSSSDDDSSSDQFLGKPVVNIDNFLLNHKDINYLYIVENNQSLILKCINNCSSHLNIYKIIDTYQIEPVYSKWIQIGKIYGFSLTETPFYGVNSLLKRLQDIILSLTILMMIAIPMLIISLLIKLTSPGPIFYKQERYGLNNEKIIVWKFRSMTFLKNDTFKQASKNDSRITWFGAILRKTSLDELPQFLNVLYGSMSIVGPRPHPIPLDEAHKEKIEKYFLRNKVKPGITGWAQINGWRGETDKLYKMENRIKFDLEYINNWSTILDFKIILLTIFKVFQDDNAY